MKIITRTEWAWDAQRGVYVPLRVETADYQGAVALAKGGGDGGSGEQRRQEDERRERVAEESSLINQTFAGGKAHKMGTTRIKDWGDFLSVSDPRTYYDADGNPINKPGGTAHTMFGVYDPNATSGPDAEMAKARKAFEGTGLFTSYADVPESTGFTDDYFNNIADAYTKFQKPMFEENLATARRELPYQFASTDSAEYQRKKGELERDAEREVAQIDSGGQDMANKQRAQVEQNRSDLLGLAVSGADMNAITQSANARAAALAKPPSFSPIADLFQKYTAASAYNPNMIGAAPGQPLYFGPNRQQQPSYYPSGTGGNSVRMVQ